MAGLRIDPAFGWVVLSATAIAVQIVITGFRFVGPARRKAFGADFFRKAKETGLLDEHKKATGQEKLPRGGYPDMGNGRFAALLPYSDWLAFNNAQRAHYNYVEGAASILTLLVASGLVFPRFSAALGAVYVVGRELYSSSYVASGADRRLAGSVLVDVALILLLGGAVGSGLAITGVDFGALVKGLLKN